MNHMVKDWVSKLGLRHQGTLLTGVRGCDTAHKHDPSKPVMRAIRWALFVAYDERELTEPKGFMFYEPANFTEAVRELAKNMDHYPSHFIWHMIHAIEVIGYCHPDAGVRAKFNWAYVTFVEKYHVNPETEFQMHRRLHEDRVAKGTVAG